jgi:hypothetical protein
MHSVRKKKCKVLLLLSALGAETAGAGANPSPTTHPPTKTCYVHARATTTQTQAERRLDQLGRKRVATTTTRQKKSVADPTAPQLGNWQSESGMDE